MKITSFYYLDYPDSCPIDPTDATTLMYVEIGEDDDDTSHFVSTYAFTVYTQVYIQNHFFRIDRSLIEGSIMIVPTIADTWMTAYLNANLQQIIEKGTER